MKRGKNKELEARCNDADRRYVEEQVSREHCELIISKLQKQVAILVEEKNKLQNDNELQAKESQALHIRGSSDLAVKITESGVEVNQIQTETTMAPIDGEQASLGSLVSFASLELLNATTTEIKTKGFEPRKEEKTATGVKNHFDPLRDKDLSEEARRDVDSSTAPGGFVSNNFDPLRPNTTKTPNPSFDPLSKENPSDVVMKGCQKQDSEDGMLSRVTGSESKAIDKNDTITHQSPKKSDNNATPRSSNAATPVHSFDPYEKDKHAV